MAICRSEHFECGCDYDNGQWFPCAMHRGIEEEDLPEAIDLWEQLIASAKQVGLMPLEHDPYDPPPLPSTVHDQPHLRLLK